MAIFRAAVSVAAAASLGACLAAGSAQNVAPASEPATIAVAPTLTEADIVDAYEALSASASPDLSARLAGEPARVWSDVSPQAVAQRAQAARDIRAMLGQVDMAEDDAAILRRLTESYVRAETLDTARVPFTGDWGFQGEPIFAAMRVRIRSVDDAEAWIARLEDIPRYFADHVENMRRGIETGWTAYGDPLATTTDQIREQIVEAPNESDLFAPFDRLPASIAPEEAERLRTDGAEAVATAVQAYRDLLAFMELDYAPAARPEPGLVTLDGGKDAYALAVEHHTAGAGYSPEDIHVLGKSEVARIRAEMDLIIEETGFDGTFSEFVAFLRTDEDFYAKTPEDLLRRASEISKRLDAVLPEYFGILPRLTYGVEPVPAAIAPGYTTGRYAQGDPKEGRPGTYLVNTYALDQRPLYQLPALSAHEAVPGHHLQIALAQELEDRPRFRQDYYATAFGEGWALYAERVAGEAGIYETPYERFGALSYEMWRACRLVADTGLHHYGWSREEAEACFKENTALAPLNIKTEVTRYIGWPGQATAYKIGELKIRELRARAEDALGEDFDIRTFHDAVLGAGSLPLDRLEVRIDAWIAEQLES